MSLGIKVLKAILRTKDRAAFKKLHTSSFDESKPDEAKLHAYIRKHIKQYGKLPSIPTVQAAGFDLKVSAEEPVAFYLQRLSERALFNVFAMGMKEVNDALQANDLTVVRNVWKATLGKAMNLGSPNDYATLSQLAQEVLEEYSVDSTTFGLKGIPTGWPTLDESTNGWLPGDSGFIVARPYMGKSYMLLRCAEAANAAGYSCVFVSNEMTPRAMARRWIGVRGKINPGYITKGTLGTWGANRMRATIEDMKSGAPVHFLAGNFTKSVAALDDMISEFQPDIAFIDAGYLMTPSDTTRRFNAEHESQKAVIDELKVCALGTGVPNLSTVQFNRNASTKPLQGSRYDLKDIGGTDAVGRNADHVLGIRKPAAPYTETHRIIEQMKIREGEPHDFGIHFSFHPMCFDECPIDLLLSGKAETGPLDTSYML